MPNTVVKLTNAESTWLEAAWEDRKLLINMKAHLQRCAFCFAFKRIVSVGWNRRENKLLIN